MLAPPMLCDVSPGAKPNPIVLLRMLQELDQSNRLGWPANEAIVQIDRHHLGMFGALFIEQIEAIHHVAGEAVGGAKAGILVESIVVRLEGRRDHKVAPLANFNPEGKLVAQVIPIVQKAAVLDQQASRIVTRATVKPAHGSLPRQLLQSRDREPDMLALGLLIDFEIVEPPIAVTDDLVAFGDKGLRQLRTLLKRPNDAEDADLDVEALEDAQQSPASAARPIFEDGFHGGVASANVGRQADIVQRILGAGVAFDKAMLASRFNIQIDVHRNPRAARPSRIGRIGTIAVKIARGATIATRLRGGKLDGRGRRSRAAHIRSISMGAQLAERRA